MAVINYNCKSKEFEFLATRIKAWQLIVPISTVAVKGDVVNINEVTEEGVLTGLSMSGSVVYSTCNDVFNYREKERLMYVIPS